MGRSTYDVNTRCRKTSLGKRPWYLDVSHRYHTAEGLYHPVNNIHADRALYGLNKKKVEGVSIAKASMVRSIQYDVSDSMAADPLEPTRENHTKKPHLVRSLLEGVSLPEALSKESRTANSLYPKGQYKSGQTQT